MKESETKSSPPNNKTRKPSLWTVLKRLVIAGASIYLGALAVVFLLQRKFLYHPPVFSAEAVEQMGTSKGLVRWRNSSGDMVGWKRASPVQPARGSILITHGNAGCAFHCSHYADVIQQAASFDVFVAEYPGYADHPGSPTEKSLNESALKAFAALPTDKLVYVVGESLGNGVAAYLAAQFPDRIAGMALLAPYKHMADVAQSHMPIFPVHWMLLDRYPAADYLLKYHGPVAIFVGGRDQVIPEKNGRGLFESYAGPKKLWAYPEADHGSVMGQSAEVWKQIIEFWDAHDSKPKVSAL